MHSTALRVPEMVAPLHRDHPLAGRIWDVRNGRFVDPAELDKALASAPPYVLLGEKHNNPDSHRLQAWALSRLVAAGRHPAVVLEMVDKDEQQTLDAHQDAAVDAGELGKALQWDKSGWPPFAIYQPIFEVALACHLPLVAGDLSHAQQVELRQQGLNAYSDAERQELGLSEPLPAELALSLRAELLESHCGQLGEKHIPAMVAIQRARDAELARALALGRQQAGSAVLIAGAGHVREDRGAPYYLRETGAADSVLSIAFFEVEVDEDDPSAYTDGASKPPFDYIWFTPRVDDEDPCAAFRKA